MKQVIYLLTIVLMTIVNIAKAQKFYTKNGNISFFSKTSMEDIKADNNQVMSVLNTETGDLQFSLLVKSFHFQKALMEEHFNENYMESDKFPKASFKGIIVDPGKIDFKKDGVYKVSVSGELTMHGVTNKVTSMGNITVAAGKISASSDFTIRVADYKIVIPKLVKDNISETIAINVNCSFGQKM